MMTFPKWTITIKYGPVSDRLTCSVEVVAKDSISAATEGERLANLVQSGSVVVKVELKP